MVLYFLTTQIDVVSQIQHQLESEDHQVQVFTDTYQFLRTVRLLGEKNIDLLCVDYLSVDVSEHNPFTEMQEQGHPIPMIFYNDPYAPSTLRAVYWAQKIRTKFGSKIDNSRFAKIREVLLTLQGAIFELEPYIYLLHRPKPCKNLDSPEEDFSLNTLKIKHHIPNSQYRLLNYFYQNRGIPVSIKSICQNLWKTYSISKRNTAYAYISFLRKILSKETSYQILLDRVEQGVYQFTISESLMRKAFKFYRH